MFRAFLIWGAPSHLTGGIRAPTRREFALPHKRGRCPPHRWNRRFEHLGSHAVTRAENKHFVCHVSGPRLEPSTVVPSFNSICFIVLSSRPPARPPRSPSSSGPARFDAQNRSPLHVKHELCPYATQVVAPFKSTVHVYRVHTLLRWARASTQNCRVQLLQQFANVLCSSCVKENCL